MSVWFWRSAGRFAASYVYASHVRYVGLIEHVEYMYCSYNNCWNGLFATFGSG